MSDTPGSVDGYRIDRLVAQGGMAEIFLARAPGGETVAIKRMKPSCALTQGYLEMFLDEARIITRFDHPNLVHAGHFEPGPPPYLVIEYIDGPTLRTLFWEAQKKQGGLPADLVAALIAQVARGLHHAHALCDLEGKPLKIVHRDLSPQNVMVTREGIAKVVDFGIARAARRATHTKAGVIKGKYAYMAPEQIVGGSIDARTDIFALGILLYEALAGQNPFSRARDDKTLFAVVRDDPTPLPEVDAKIPDDLWQVAARALQKQPADRFESAAAVADAIDASIATRRKPVGRAHLADYLRGLWDLPVPDGARPPDPLKDSEISLIDLEIGPTDHAMEAVDLPVTKADQTLADLGAEASLGSPDVPDPKARFAQLQAAATIRRSPVGDRPSHRQLLFWAGLTLAALGLGAAVATLLA